MATPERTRAELGAAWWVPTYLRAVGVLVILLEIVSYVAARRATPQAGHALDAGGAALYGTLCCAIAMWCALGLEQGGRGWRPALIVVLGWGAMIGVAFAVALTIHGADDRMHVLGIRRPSPALAWSALIATEALFIAPLPALLDRRTARAFAARAQLADGAE